MEKKQYEDIEVKRERVVVGDEGGCEFTGGRKRERRDGRVRSGNYSRRGRRRKGKMELT